MATWGGIEAGRAGVSASTRRPAPEVVVSTRWTGRSPEQVDASITSPLARRLVGTPEVTSVRGRSSLGRSTVTVTFADGVDGSWARERVAEALPRRDRSSLGWPADATPALGPDATEADRVFRYALVDDAGQRDLQ
ncbi:MAG: efflux RND transporter permease subunit, partial [Myxococcota bacterium]